MQNVVNMKQKNNLICLIMLLVFLVCIPLNVSEASTLVMPSEEQYLEMRATTIKEVDGQGKQVIMELWGHEIDFKRI